MKKLLLCVMFALPVIANAQQVFNQDFSGAWEGTGANQFVKNADGAGTVLLNSESLRFTKGGNAIDVSNATIAAKNTGLGTTGLICIKFDYTPVTATSTNNAFFVQLGTGFTTGVQGLEDRSNTSTKCFALLAVGNSTNKVVLGATGNQGGSITAAAATGGKQTIYWIVNKSGAQRIYTGPDGSTGNIIDNNMSAAWMGNTKCVFTGGSGTTNSGTNIPVTSTAVTAITDVKFSLANAASGFQADFDQVSLYNLPLTGTTLPVKITAFTARAVKNQVDLNWTTVSEQQAAYYEVRRSTDGIHYNSIGRVNAAGNSTGDRQYSFTDAAPAKGYNYYTLDQYDTDGRPYKQLKVAVCKIGAPALTIAGYNPQEKQLRILSPAVMTGSLLVYDVAGRLLKSSAVSLMEGMNAVAFPLAGGDVSFLTLATPQGRVTSKLFVPR